MATPIVHFEIMGSDEQRTTSFYNTLFGWNADTNNDFHYGMVDNGGQGINGGLGGGGARVSVYAGVDDPQKYLDRAVELGGTVLIPVTEIPGAVTMALFSDPDGNSIGLIKNM